MTRKLLRAATLGAIFMFVGCGAGTPDNERVDTSSQADLASDPAMAAAASNAKKAAAEIDKGGKAAPTPKGK